MGPFIIPIFLPQMGCPFRCLYCDQKTITQSPAQDLTRETFKATVEAGLSSKKKKTGQETEIAFFGGTFTNLPSDYQHRLLEWAGSYIADKRVASLRLSTRPDALSEKKIEQLLASGVGTIELGVQSLDDRVLTLSNRGHTAQTARKALSLLKKYSLQIGVQLMMGLPGDSGEGFLRTVKEVVTLKPHLVRIYPTLVFQGTDLAQWLYEGRYHPLSLDEALSSGSRALELFEENGIRVIRLGLQENDGLRLGKNLVAGPYHPAFGSLARGELFLKKVLQGLRSQKSLPPHITLEISPYDVSYLTGNKRRNLDRLIREIAVPGLKVLVNKTHRTGQWSWF